MNKDIKSIFTATVNNKVVVVETNLKAFIEKLRIIEPDIKSYDIYYREFKKSNYIMFENNKKEVYHLQETLNNERKE